MKRYIFSCMLFGLISLAGVTAFACLWDRDTLEMERQRFPTALELITGKFLRHSPAFYIWRVQDRESRRAAGSSPELLDDLAVAYEKTGKTDEAIRIMEEKASKYPGLYETHANLGTFYIHAGRLTDGLVEIEKALEINPDAHFGRELYQKRLVEYLLSLGGEDQLSLPMSSDATAGMVPTGFGKFLLSRPELTDSPEEQKNVLDDAIQGVLGMMKFGNHDSPILLEALADLLLSHRYSVDAKQLASRAYLKASMESEDVQEKDAYRNKAKECLKFQTDGSKSNDELPFGVIASQFDAEIKDAEEWYSTISGDEAAWLEQGINLDEAFEVKYYSDPAPVLTHPKRTFSSRILGEQKVSSPSIGFAIAGILLIAAVVVFVRNRRSKI